MKKIILVFAVLLAFFACKAQTTPEYDGVRLRKDLTLKGTKVTSIMPDTLVNPAFVREYVLTHPSEGGGSGTADPDSVYETLSANDSFLLRDVWYKVLIEDPGAINNSILFYDSLNSRWIAKELVDITDSVLIDTFSNGISIEAAHDSTRIPYFKNNNKLTSSANFRFTGKILNLGSSVNYSCAIGTENGNFTGGATTLLGWRAGNVLTSGYSNTLLGSEAGRLITTGYGNVCVGMAMAANATGNLNTVIGFAASGHTYGGSNVSNNVLLGSYAGNYLTGNNNVFIGYYAGDSAGSGNVMIGYEAGLYEKGSNKLYIDNSNTNTPLIHGDFTTDKVTINKYLKIAPWAIATPSPARGDIYTNNTDGHLYYHNGTIWNQLDQQSSIVGGVIERATQLATSIAFNKPVTVYSQFTITTNKTLSPNTSQALAGCGAILRAVGDGSHTLTFSGFVGTDVFDNTSGTVNLISFIFDGYSYWYTIKKN